jgi:TRAP-type C4-dicarboxylate transport system permease small subunit
MKALLTWLHRRAENLLVLMMLAMFVAFILQIVFRYFLNLPVGWTEEVCVLAWLWGILWGSALVTRDDEAIRFDMLYAQVSPTTRRVFRAVAGLVFIVIMGLALPATWGYVRFMKVESTAALAIPFSWVFSVYLLFAVSMIVRQAHIVWTALRGGPPAEGAHA